MAGWADIGSFFDWLQWGQKSGTGVPSGQVGGPYMTGVSPETLAYLEGQLGDLLQPILQGQPSTWSGIQTAGRAGRITPPGGQPGATPAGQKPAAGSTTPGTPTGTATPGLVSSPGISASNLGASSAVPLPFNASYYHNRTEVYGQKFNGSTEMGNDFGMPVGTAITTPFGGKIHLEDSGHRNWGKRVFVILPNGMRFAVGHMHGFAVTEGETVSPGSLLGVSGGAIDDPSSGFSSGPHVEVQFINQQGQFVNPQTYIDAIFKGTTFGNLDGLMAGLSQSGFTESTQVFGQAQNLQYTPDNQLIDLNTPEGRWYSTVDGMWTGIFGVHAPLWAATQAHDTGIQNVDQLRQSLYAMPSHIPGLTIGAYESARSAIQNEADKRWGKPVPDSLIAQLSAKGISSPADIQDWFDTHNSSDVPKDAYTAIYNAALPYTQATTGDVPHPSDIAGLWALAGGAPATMQAPLPPPTNAPQTLLPTGEQIPLGVARGA